MASHLSFELLFLLLSIQVSTGKTQDYPVHPGRAAHYVIRASDLEASLKFLQAVFGMKVIRHEENEAACPITCNGRYPTPWSKTMVGYETEDRAYAFEITYNYGVDTYKLGSGLKEFELFVDDLEISRLAARDLGYHVEDVSTNSIQVIGPDGYRFLLQSALSDHLQVAAPRRERFLSISLQVPDPAETASWYTDILGMRRSSATSVSFDPFDDIESVSIKFLPAAADYSIEQWDGRNMFSLPAARVRAIHARLAAEMPQRIVHDLRVLQERLGELLLLIITDPNGLEICLASSETFDAAVRSAANWEGPDWEHRANLEVEYTAAVRDVASEGGTMPNFAEEKRSDML